MKTTHILHLNELVLYHQFTDYYADKLAIVTIDAATPGLGHIKPVCLNVYSIVLIQNGSCTYSINGREVTTAVGELLLLTPEHMTGILHFSPDFKGLHLMVERHFYEHIASLDSRTLFATVAHHPKVSADASLCTDLEQVMTQIRTALHRNYRQADQIIARLVNVVQVYAEEALLRPQPTLVAPTHKESLFRRFIGLMVTHFKREHQIEYYASELCITTTYLSRIVREISSNTVNGFISELLYNECCHLLRTTDKSLAEIADSLNFSTQSSLGKFFKKHAGMSPVAYRKAVAGFAHL